MVLKLMSLGNTSKGSAVIHRPRKGSKSWGVECSAMQCEKVLIQLRTASLGEREREKKVGGGGGSERHNRLEGGV
jgi:hypothetical protein